MAELLDAIRDNPVPWLIAGGCILGWILIASTISWLILKCLKRKKYMQDVEKAKEYSLKAGKIHEHYDIE
jgi:hypothetical protein